MMNDKPRVVFLHIPKTGGTTLDQLLRSHYTTDETCPERLGNIGLWPPERLSNFKFFSMHDTFDNLQCIPSPKKILTIFREPIDRSISVYTYWRSYDNDYVERQNIHLPRLAKANDFKSFLKCPTPKLYHIVDNVMTRFLTDHTFNSEGKVWRSDTEILDAALVNLEKIDVFGLNEYFDESVDLIFRTLDLSAPDSVSVSNKTRDNHLSNSAQFHPVEEVEIDDETEELLVNLNRLDTVIYKEAKNRFLARIGDTPRRLSGFHSAVGRITRHYKRTVAHARQDEPGFVLFGPHLRLKAGRYRVTLEIGYRVELPLPAAVLLCVVDVCSHHGEKIHYRREISSDDVQLDAFGALVIDFVLDRTASDLEVRIFHMGLGDVFVDATPAIELL